MNDGSHDVHGQKLRVDHKAISNGHSKFQPKQESAPNSFRNSVMLRFIQETMINCSWINFSEGMGYLQRRLCSS